MRAGKDRAFAVLEPFANAGLDYAEIDSVVVSSKDAQWEWLRETLLAEIRARRSKRRAPGRPRKGVGSGSFGSTEEAVKVVRAAYAVNGEASNRDMAEALHISTTLLWRIRKLAGL